MKTFSEVAEWCLGAAEAYGDASVPVCQLFFRWQPDLQKFDDHGADETLVCGMVMGEFALVCGRSAVIPLPIRTGEAEVTRDEVITYGAGRVVDGVWAITPSLNVEGFIHGFVILYGVPDPAPWDRLIVLAEAR